MPIINQNYDMSEKKAVIYETFAALATGITQVVGTMPYDCLLQGFTENVFGISGSPIHSLSVFRFAGGLTSLPLAITLTLQSYGTSGSLGFSVAPPGISLLAGDVLCLTTGGANTSTTACTVSAVISAIADIKAYNNTVA